MFCYKKKVFATNFLAFSLNNDKWKSLGEVALSFLLETTAKGEMENYTTMQCLILEWRLEQRFITTFIRQLRECIQFSIKFMREFWLLNKTSKMDYVLMKTLWINIERTTKFPTHLGEKFFPHLLMQKHKRYLFFFFWPDVFYNNLWDLFLRICKNVIYQQGTAYGVRVTCLIICSRENNLTYNGLLNLY